MAHESALNLPNPWAAVGRDTEAGRALFALYNGFGHARSRGNDYSQMNRVKHLRHIAVHGVPEFPVPKPLPPKKPEVKVPHFPHKSYCFDDYHPVDFIPRRRRAAEILQQIRDDSYVVDPPPMPKGPLLDEAEKARLQEIFYWSNRNLGPEPPVAEPVKRLPKKGSIEEQELLLNEIAKEVEDREAFLNEMEEYGKGEEYRGQIVFEIQQRVGQMKLLHQNITEQEKRENEKKSEITSPSDQLYIAPPPKSYARGRRAKANVTTLTFDPRFDQGPRFERSFDSTRQATQHPSFDTSRADETPGFTSSPHDAALSTDPFMTTGTDTPIPSASTPNVIKTESCYGDDPPVSPMLDSQQHQQPTTKSPPTKLPTTKKTVNLNLVLSSPPNSIGVCLPAFCLSPTGSAAASTAPSSLRNDPRSRDPVRCAPSGGKPSSDQDTSRVSSTCNANYPSGSTPWTYSRSPRSPGRSPSSIASDPRCRAQGVRFQPSGTPSGSLMSAMPFNPSPSGSTRWDEYPTSSTARLQASPPDFARSRGGVKSAHSPKTSELLLSGVTSNSNADFPPRPSCWDDPCSPAQSPSSISSYPRSQVQGRQLQPSGGSIPEYISGMPSNSMEATYPSRPTPWDGGGCSPMDSPHHSNYVDRDD